MDLTAEQSLVINCKNKSILVSASAGSGKTFVVVKRIIQSIKDGQDISRLLILTFTNAAASELKERIVKGLYELKEEYFNNNDLNNVKRISKQITKVSMADVSTIHSFCLNIIKNNFEKLGIDPMISTLDVNKANIYLNEIIVDLMDEEYEKNVPEFIELLDIIGSEEKLIETLYTTYLAYENILYNDVWLENIHKIYSDKEVKDLSHTYFGMVIINSVKDKLKLCKFEIDKLINEIDGLEDFETRKEALKLINEKICIALNKQKYDDIYNYLDDLTCFPHFPQTKVADLNLKDEVLKIKNNVLKSLKDLRKIIYSDSKGILQELNSVSKYINWYIEKIKDIDERFKKLKNEKNLIEFSDYEHMAIKALEDQTVCKFYKNKYDEIYIDEYQDTSYAQEEIIKKISKDNNVIRVGDVKQSIYAFRNANPELFTQKYINLNEIKNENDKLEQGKIILSNNFRSREEVINSINGVFSFLMSEAFGGAVYEEKEKLVYGADYDKSLNQDYKTEINIIEKENEKEFEEEEDQEYEDTKDIIKEAYAVSNRISDLIKSGFMVYDLKEKKYRKCEFKDIAILMRTIEGKANILRDILLSNNIKAYTDNKEGMYDSDEVNLIISFLNVLDNPLDDISLVSIMYSIIGKFDLDDLVYICENKNEKHIYDILINNDNEFNDEINIKIKRLVELINRYRKYVNVYKVSEIIQKLYNETAIYDRMAVENMGSMKCSNLEGLVNVVTEYENNESITSLYLILSYLKTLKSKTSSGDSPKIIGENENAVRIMSIHKSKGLEFPIVILMDTEAKYNEKDLRNKVLFDEVLGMGIDIFNKEYNITYPSIIKQAIKEKKKRILRSEALRLLYVAFTRAKEKLIVYGSANNIGKLFEKLNNNSDKISPSVAYTYSNFLNLIISAYLMHDSNFNLNILKINKVKNESVAIDRNKEITEILYKKCKKLNIVRNEENIKSIQDKFNKTPCVNNLERKYTVTGLKKKEEEVFLNELKPETITTKITNVGYGTFIHSIIEHLDYSNVDEENVKKCVISQAQALNFEDKVDISKVIKSILVMYDNMEEILNNAKSIKNELEFVIKDKLDNIETLDFKEDILIQGVVDMYVLTKDGKHIIVDFKTDMTHDEKDLLRLYTLQLKIYKRAIELSYNVSVDSVYIYSFSLNKLIEVK